MARVSVIVPVYNVENYLRECMDSIINQTFSDIEIICVNDGSTDSSLEILNKYMKQDNRIKIISKKNDGLGQARNTGLEYVTTNLVCFIDSDDYFKNDAIEKLYDAYERTRAEIVVAKVQLFKDITNEKIDIRGWNKNYKPLKCIFNRNDCCDSLYQLISQMTHAKLFSVNLIKKYNLKFHKCRMHEDLTFVYTACALANSIFLLDEVVYMYRAFRVGSLVSINRGNSDSWKEFNLAFNLLENNLKNNDIYKIIKKTYINSLIFIILGHLKNVNWVNKLQLIKYVRENYTYLKNLQKKDIYNKYYFYLIKLILL